jgi:hypothetical protein
MLATCIIFKKLTKVNNRPKGRKFAQSGHPVSNVYSYAVLAKNIEN